MSLPKLFLGLDPKSTNITVDTTSSGRKVLTRHKSTKSPATKSNYTANSGSHLDARRSHTSSGHPSLAEQSRAGSVDFPPASIPQHEYSTGHPAYWSQAQNAARGTAYSGDPTDSGTYDSGRYTQPPVGSDAAWRYPRQEYASSVPQAWDAGASEPIPSSSETPIGMDTNPTYPASEIPPVPMPEPEPPSLSWTYERERGGRRRYTTVLEDGTEVTDFGPWEANSRKVCAGIKRIDLNPRESTSEGGQASRPTHIPARAFVFNTVENFKDTELYNWLSEMRLKDVIDEFYPEFDSGLKSQLVDSLVGCLIPRYHHEDLCEYTIDRGEEIMADWSQVQARDTAKGEWWTKASEYGEWVDRWMRWQGMEPPNSSGAERKHESSDRDYHTTIREPPGQKHRERRGRYRYG
ncbi:hypothetical protein IAU59_007221 [Kwoniella sp. CBS 9459]